VNFCFRLHPLECNPCSIEYGTAPGRQIIWNLENLSWHHNLEGLCSVIFDVLTEAKEKIAVSSFAAKVELKKRQNVT
jgi:hypothetical protein